MQVGEEGIRSSIRRDVLPIDGDLVAQFAPALIGKSLQVILGAVLNEIFVHIHLGSRGQRDESILVVKSCIAHLVWKGVQIGKRRISPPSGRGRSGGSPTTGCGCSRRAGARGQGGLVALAKTNVKDGGRFPLWVPHSGTAIKTAGNDQLPIMAEKGTGDRAIMTNTGATLTAVTRKRHSKYSTGAIPRSSHQLAAIIGKCDSKNASVVRGLLQHQLCVEGL